MAYADPRDVSDRLGRALTDDEDNLAAVLLDDAERKLKRRIPDLADRIADPETGEDYLETVIMVEALAVKRVLINPGGWRSETVGPFSRALDTRAAAGFLTILDEEWSDLGISGGSFTIRPYLETPPVVAPNLWTPLP